MLKIGIVGLGLIGGSLAVDLRSHDDIEVLGISHKLETCRQAEQQEIVDRAILLLNNGLSDEAQVNSLKDLDILFICTPIDLIIPTLKLFIEKDYLAPKTIVTDVGSVKNCIVKKASQLWDNFIGGHPMAGTEESGISAARANLFQNATYVFTPTKKTNETNLNILKNIAKNKLGSRVYECSPETHDRAVALISHAPVMISAALIKTCISENNEEVLKAAKQLASSGFRDTSRVGGGNPELGLMMAKNNRENVLRSLKQYQANLTEIIEAIEQEKWSDRENEKNLKKLLESTQRSRPDFLS
jgi:arogenate dehydrogenase (NADP+)